MIRRLIYLNSLLLMVACSSKNKPIFEGENQIDKHSRGISVSQDKFLVAGADGVYSIFSEDFTQITDSVKGAEDIRDVQLFSDGCFLLMNSGDNGIIWYAGPGGDSIHKTYEKEGVFLDGFAFWDNGVGIAYGDPVNGKMVILTTIDSGQLWRAIDYNILPYCLPNEGGFAASGTGIAAVGISTVIIGTGMADTARLHISKDYGLNWEIKNTPIKAGDSYGIYSMYFWSENEGIIIGGSYLHPEDTEKLCFYTNDGGDSWVERINGLKGYTSCVHGTGDGAFLIATGRVGTFYSKDKGLNWQLFTEEKFYSVRIYKNYAYFSGSNGVVKVFDIQHFIDD